MGDEWDSYLFSVLSPLDIFSLVWLLKGDVSNRCPCKYRGGDGRTYGVCTRFLVGISPYFFAHSSGDYLRQRMGVLKLAFSQLYFSRLGC